MSFDAWIVGYGLAVVMGTLFGLINIGYAIWAMVIGIDAILLLRFFRQRRILAPSVLSRSGGGLVPPERLDGPAPSQRAEDARPETENG